MLEFFNNVADIQSVGVSSTAAGNQYSQTTVYSNVPVQIQPITNSLMLSNDTRYVGVTHNVYTNQNITVSPGWLVIYGSRTFKIIFNTNLDEMNTVWCMSCTELLDETL